MSISVLMAVYNAEKPEYLDRAIQSIWSDQTVRPDQVIIVEDGPLGHELEAVINKWSLEIGRHLTVLKNDENIGLTKSLNRGVQAVTSTYIARMDSDDISLPNRFALQSDYLDQHPHISVLGGSMREIDENENEGAERIYPFCTQRIRAYIAKANPIAHPTVMMRKELFDKGVRYNENYRKNQDLQLWFDLLADGYQMGNLSDVILKFRRTSDTYTKRSSKSSLDSEYRIYTSGIKRLYGAMNWRLCYPMLRYIVKSMPIGFIDFVYKYLFKKKNK